MIGIKTLLKAHNLVVFCFQRGRTLGGNWVFECPNAPGGSQIGPGGFLCALPLVVTAQWAWETEQGRWIDLAFYTESYFLRDGA